MRWQATLECPQTRKWPPAELILETGVGPLDTGTDPETHAPGIDMASRTPGLSTPHS